MWIQSITRKGATLNFRLSIYNPNTFPLEIKSLTYKASKTSDGVEIASGKLQDSILVLAEESGVANASVVISFGGLGAASKSIARRGKTEFEIGGMISIGVGAKNRVLTLPYSSRAEFSLFDQVPVPPHSVAG